MRSISKRSIPKTSGPKGCSRSKALGAAALAAALITATAHAVTVHAATSADAHESAAHPKLVLSGYEEQAAGADLLAGRYGRVIAELGPHGARFGGDQIATSTNLCVAYIMTAKWDAARSACDEAVTLTELDVPDRDLTSRETHAEQVALAYSNRAVLNWLEDRRASAADDLSKAHHVAPASPFVSENLAAFASRRLAVVARAERRTPAG